MSTALVTKLAGAIAGISLFALTAGPAHAAGTASLSINGGTYQQGATFTSVVRETSTEAVISVEANLTYDASKLECLGISGAGSAFAMEYPSSCGGGNISINRTTAGGTTVTGTQTVATVTFRALAGSGNANVNFAASSGIYDTNVDNIWNGNTAGAGYAFTSAPTPAPTQAPTTTPKPTAKPAANAPAPSGGTTAPAATAGTAATGARTAANAQAGVTGNAVEASPASEATVSPTPMEGQAIFEPAVFPAPEATDSPRAISNKTIWSILAVLAAGATALYVVRRMKRN